MTNEWQGGGAAILPDRITLTDEQVERIKADLWRIGITRDVFAMDPYQRKELLSQSRITAAAVYTAIMMATGDQYTLTQTFKEWSRGLGLPW